MSNIDTDSSCKPAEGDPKAQSKIVPLEQIKITVNVNLPNTMQTSFTSNSSAKGHGQGPGGHLHTNTNSRNSTLSVRQRLSTAVSEVIKHDMNDLSKEFSKRYSLNGSRLLRPTNREEADDVGVVLEDEPTCCFFSSSIGVVLYFAISTR